MAICNIVDVELNHNQIVIYRYPNMEVSKMNETNNVSNGSVYRPNMSGQRPQTMSGFTTPPGNAVQQGYMPGPGNAQMGYW